MDGNKRARRRRGRGIERLKSILIVLLTLSALALTGRVMLYTSASVNTPQGWLGDLITLFRPEDGDAAATPDSSAQAAAAAQPVRIAVHDGSKRFAAQYDTELTDRMFDSLGILLSEALSSAKTPQLVKEAAWRQALQSPGVWFDFLGSIPLEALYAWMGEGGSNPALTADARQMAVALDLDGVVRLYYHNENDGLYYACDTTVAYSGHMDELLQGYGGNGLSFVFELAPESGYRDLDPYVLLTSGPLEPVVYRAGNPLAAISQETIQTLQAITGFQTQSDSVYPVQGGFRIREGRESMEINENGTVIYQASEENASRYPVGEGGSYTTAELVETTRKLAAETVGRSCGAARLYLMEVAAESDGSVSVRYGYSLDGASVYLGEDGSAACFTVRDGQITEYTLRFRSYEDSGSTRAVMRELQAAAALEALESEGRRLELCYSDGGGDTVQAGWVAR